MAEPFILLKPTFCTGLLFSIVGSSFLPSDIYLPEL
ncbi:MAG: hypothetical protein MRERV_13c043 [Mycoplasmataceae bacterium RV_VA103A]|nr:MAG: hypothetical protein MRERV_13c043 [Mycoplasmataceae bacterium RV_VA103A]